MTRFASFSVGTLAFAFFIACSTIASSRTFAQEIEFSYTNSFDNSTQQAIAYIPAACAGKKSPLLVVAHYWWGDRFTARQIGYNPECEARGWLLVCPQLHGHRTSYATALASLESQHDIIDAIGYMKKNYMVDSSRIFLAGRSMGGMTAQIMAAKYPDLFAGVVAGQGIADLKAWIDASPSFREGVEKECGVFADSTAFEYARRSSINYASNFAYVPLVLWHGTNDHMVASKQTADLAAMISRFTKTQPPVSWLFGAAHIAVNYPPSWECGQLAYFQNICEGGMSLPTRFFPELELTTDEDKQFFWLDLTRAAGTKFGTIAAAVRHDSLIIKAKNLKKVSVNLNLIPGLKPFSRYAAAADRPLEVVIEKNKLTVFSFQCKGTASGIFKQ